MTKNLNLSIFTVSTSEEYMNYSAECTAYVRKNGAVVPEQVSVSGNYTIDSVAKVKLSWKLQDQAKRTWKKSVVELKNVNFFCCGEKFR